MKQYLEPAIDFIAMQNQDVITTSGGWIKPQPEEDGEKGDIF